MQMSLERSLEGNFSAEVALNLSSTPPCLIVFPREGAIVLCDERAALFVELMGFDEPDMWVWSWDDSLKDPLKAF